MRLTDICKVPNVDGSRNVSFRSTPRADWIHSGRLMPAVENHTPEQPTSYAKKLLQAHINANRTDFIVDSQGIATDVRGG